ncbi:MAG: sigma-54 dependent transcriptional regulator [Candidatus Binatia bacterium]
MATLLVIEDEIVLGKNIRKTLEKLGHAVEVATSGAEGERLFGELHPDLTLLDLRLPDASGLELLPRLKAAHPEGVVVLMTAYAAIEDAVRAMKLGAADYLQKPLNLDELRQVVSQLLDTAQLQQEVSYYRRRESRGAELDALIGRCPAIDELRSRIRRLATLPAGAPPTVLITGETGTGKGLVARVLHYSGARADRPFIEVNCAAIPENLVEAELFGYERGAFTDAKTAKVGLIQAADRGTLFLDEIGCLPLAFQAKILKAIEDKTVRPVGGRSERRVDVHIVTATNSDLAAMSRAGQFREDLFYRLQVAQLHIPPLRERGEDVVLIATALLRDLCREYRLPARQLSDAALDAIRHYRWPGNVRELRNTLDRAVLFSDDDTVGPDALALPVPISQVGAAPMAVGESGELRFEIPDGGVRFEDIERALLVSALRKAGGSQSAAARLLGLSRDTLRYRMEKFGIESE